jgi:hypothetical protein
VIPPLDRISRRALLKGTCASLLLPFLPSLSWADDAAAPAPKPPRRWATILFPNGVLDEDWWAKGRGQDMELSKSLQPLAPHRGQFTVIDTMRRVDAVPLGSHGGHFHNILHGATFPGGAESCDQVMARTIGMACSLPSLALGCEALSYGLTAEGLPAIGSGTISWASANSGIPPINSPRDAFDQLFDTKSLERQRGVLDYVLADLGDVRGNLSGDDRRKLDEYTDSVRDLERRIDRASQPLPPGAWKPTLEKPDMLRPAQDTAQILGQPLIVRNRLMFRILEMAFRMDKTRVATFLLANDQSGVPMGFVEGVGNLGLHLPLAHHGADPALTRQFQLTNQYFVKCFADFLGKLRAVDEGGSSLLDSSMILFGSNVRDNHDANNLPLILAGGGGGTLKPGACLAFDKNEDRRLCNLHLALMQRMGVTIDGRPIDRFGNSVKPIDGI